MFARMDEPEPRNGARRPGRRAAAPIEPDASRGELAADNPVLPRRSPGRHLDHHLHGGSPVAPVDLADLERVLGALRRMP